MLSSSQKKDVEASNFCTHNEDFFPSKLISQNLSFTKIRVEQEEHLKYLCPYSRSMRGSTFQVDYLFNVQ